MRKKIIGFALSALLLALRFPAEAQQPKKVPRIGYLRLSAGPSERVEAFRQGLRELGYVEGQNIVIEYRFGDENPDRLLDLAAELVRLRVDVIVTEGGTPVVRAAKRATTTIPIVFGANPDPVGSGVVASLARPGGNVTGLSFLGADLVAKLLELLKEAFPRVSRVAVLEHPNAHDERTVRNMVNETEAAAKTLGVQLQLVEVRGPNDFDEAFAAMTRKRASALIVWPSPMFFVERRRIVDLAARSRLPAMYSLREYVDVGGLMSYGASIPDSYRRAATYVDKILKGAKPADLPVEQPTKFELIINLKTAKQISVTIPPNVLARADKVLR